ncbi:MAG TPA: hypothetical protein VN622_14040 [Clostridia bacterium]|nr:hypothetical protein [Clostridia bacterium]
MKNETGMVVYKPQQSALTPRGFLMVVFRRHKLIALSFAGLFIGVLLAIMVLPEQYQAEMSLLIQRERLDPVVSSATRATPDVQAQMAKLSEEDVNSEVDLMQSEDVLRKVVLTCGLENGLSWYRKLLPGRAKYFMWPDHDTRTGYAVKTLEDKLDVQPPNQSNLVKITYTNSSPEMASQVLQTLAAVYMQKHVEVHRPSDAYKFFQNAVDQYRKDLTDAQARLVLFGKNEHVVAAEQEKTNSLQRMAEFDASLQTTRAAISETQHRISELEALAKTTPPRRTTSVTTSATLLEELRSTLFNLNMKRTDLLNKYDPKYRLVTDVDKQIAETQAAIAKAESAPTVEQTTDGDPTYDWLSSELAKARSELAGLRARAAETERIVGAYRQKGQHLDEKGFQQQDLVRASKVAEENYMNAVRRQEEARMSEELDRSRIVNVAMAGTPNIPLIPNTSPLTKAAIGLFVAMMLSMGIAFVVDHLDSSFHTPDEMEDYLALPVLAAVPKSAELTGVDRRAS